MKVRWDVTVTALGLVLVAGISILSQHNIITVDRISICKLELPPFVHLTPNKAITNKKTLASLTDEGYIAKSGYTINYPPGAQWSRSNHQHRSVNFDYHTWTILAPLLATLEEPELPDQLSRGISDLIISTAQEWFSLFDTFKRHKIGSNFSWYDMAVGLRANMLPYILKMGACSDKVSDEDFARWWIIAIQHAEVLARESFHQMKNNHGLYQALGHYAFCKKLSMIDRCNDDLVLAKLRVKEYISNYFSKSGIHLEHSPGYQLYMLLAFKQFLTHPDLSTIITPEFVDKVSETLDYFILPNNKLAQLGDTDAKQVKRKNPRPKQPEMRLFSEAGYSVVHHTNGHLIISAAFHSRTHKHADDGTFVWFDRGKPLIVDSGRYGYGRINITDKQRDALRAKGYWYSDPKRIYVESTHAHNTVEIDSESDNRAKSEFYGSGLKGGFAREDGTFYFYLNMPRASGNITQRRVLVYQPGEWLLIIDEMTPTDDNTHDYTSWLQLDPAAKRLSTSAHSASFRFEKEELTITTLSPNTAIYLDRGEVEPRLVGWRAPSSVLLPAWSVGAKTSGSHKVRITNLLSLSGPPQPISLKRPIMVSMPDGTLKFEWLNDGKPVFIRICKDWAADPARCT